MLLSYFTKAGMKSTLQWLILANIFLFSYGNTNAQLTQDTIDIFTLQQAQELTLSNNLTLKIGGLQVSKQEVLQKSAANIPSTSLYYGKEEFGHQMAGIQSIGVQQSINFPTTYKRRKSLLEEETKLQSAQNEVDRNYLLYEIQLSWYRLQTAFKRSAWQNRLDSFYTHFVQAAKLRFETGETNKLEYLAAKEEWNRIQILRSRTATEIKQQQIYLRSLIQPASPVVFHASESVKVENNENHSFDTSSFSLTPSGSLLDQKIQVAEKETALEKSKLLPSIEAGYALQNINNQAGFHSFQIGIGIPLLGGSGKNKVKALQIDSDIRRKEFDKVKLEMAARHRRLTAQYNETKKQIDYYENEGLSSSEERIRSSRMAYDKGEIGYMELIQNINAAAKLQEDYWDTLDQYNQIILEIRALRGTTSL